MGHLVVYNVENMPDDQRKIIEVIAHNVGTDIDDLLSAIQIVFNCTLDDLKSCRKDNNLPYARRIVFYYANKILSKEGTASKRKIGELLDKKPSGVSYDIKVFKNQNNKKANSVFFQYVQRIIALLYGRWFIEE